MYAKSFQLCLTVIPWILAHQAPLYMGFPRQDYWNALPCPSPGDLPDSGIKPASPESPALTGRVLYNCHLGTYKCLWHIVICHFLQPFIERSKSFPSLPYPHNSLQPTHGLSNQMVIPSLGGHLPTFSIHHHSCFKMQKNISFVQDQSEPTLSREEGKWKRY